MPDMTKVLITGANGQLGSDIVQSMLTSGYDVIGLTHQDLDIGNLMEVKKALLHYRPQLVINTAAFHHVDQCEADSKKARLINAESPAFIARMCRYLNMQLIHFSTDYVFGGDKNAPYIETDTTAPLNVYGKSKREGELRIQHEGAPHLILRVSALYGKQPCRAKNGLNFIQLMLKLAREKGEVTVVDDEFVSPTSTENIATILPELIKRELQGIVHLTSDGHCSWYDFAAEIFNLTQTDVVLKRATPVVDTTKTPRPKYSVLENAVLHNQGIPDMKHWKDALHDYLKDLN